MVETRSETFTLGSRSERARLVASKCGALQSAFRTRLVGGSGNGGTWGAEVYGYPQCPTDVHISVWPCGHVDMYWISHTYPYIHGDPQEMWISIGNPIYIYPYIHGDAQDMWISAGHRMAICAAWDIRFGALKALFHVVLCN